MVFASLPRIRHFALTSVGTCLLSVSSLASAPVLVGCDKEVAPEAGPVEENATVKTDPKAETTIDPAITSHLNAMGIDPKDHAAHLEEMKKKGMDPAEHIKGMKGGHGGHGKMAEGHVHHGGHHRFQDAEKWAKVFDDPERDTWQKPADVAEFVALRDGDDVAILGAGTGYFAVRFAALIGAGKLFANDVEDDMVAYLGERAAKEGLDNVVAVKGAADDPKIPENVDVVFVCDVYHHIEDPAAFFAKVAGKLEDDGRLIIVDFKPDAPEDAPGPPKAMRVEAAAIVEALAPAGFEQRRIDTSTLPYQYMLELGRTSK